jgi:hypothetical protein
MFEDLLSLVGFRRPAVPLSRRGLTRQEGEGENGSTRKDPLPEVDAFSELVSSGFNR